MPQCDEGRAPVLSGDGSEAVMLIGQAPGWREIEVGLPFAWDAGKRLVGWLELAGVSLADFRERWYVTSIGKCYPGRAPGASVDKPPSRAEIARWTPFLREELRLVAPEVIVLVGGTAHRFAFGPAVRLETIVGRAVTWEAAPAATVICLPHPSGASTWLNADAHAALWRDAVGLLAAHWAAIGNAATP